MATLSAIRRDDRGQLLLVGAFILAILLVALAMVLNAAIYTETYAAQGNDRADVFDTVQYRGDTEGALEGLVATVNDRQYITRSDARANLTAGIGDWDTINAREQAATGRATSLTFDESDIHVLTNVSQTNDSLSFTNNSTEPDWAVVENVTDTQSFTLAVAPTDVGITEADSNDTAVLESSAFHVEVVNNSTTWNVYVFQWSSNLTVAVESSDSPGLDTYNTTYTSGELVELNFTNASIDGTDAPILQFYGDVSGEYTLNFSNGDNATGNYTLVVDGDVVTPDDYSDDPAAGPTARAVVTQLDVTLRYEMQNLSYETPISVTGGANDV
ncbi:MULTISPECIES: hypothetical protein [Haloferax]|uniref:Uncharacterized protein n=1 Tax=Haloferax marinum TaxID=2666143 RepID=A0A6A8G9Z5_9EURY|nr:MULTISPECIES: hypothetical protein [Haloferax]KAB1191154.1 hypothetical protein Hfx1150_15850 [Haloferax sp. CBA1150]MRW98040.1 hypothetical protein [Haloferax marinum]